MRPTSKPTYEEALAHAFNGLVERMERRAELGHPYSHALGLCEIACSCDIIAFVYGVDGEKASTDLRRIAEEWSDPEPRGATA